MHRVGQTARRRASWGRECASVAVPALRSAREG